MEQANIQTFEPFNIVKDVFQVSSGNTSLRFSKMLFPGYEGRVSGSASLKSEQICTRCWNGYDADKDFLIGCQEKYLSKDKQTSFYVPFRQ